MPKSLSFANVIKAIAMLSFAVTVFFVLLYRLYGHAWLLTAAISTGTTFYHFAMRLVVGWIVPRCMKHPMQYRWFQQKPFEHKLYQFFKIKHWKDRMPTYDPGSFSMQNHSLLQIAENCCVSEAVHEIIILFSFVPLVFTLWWGAFPVFLITSLLAAAFDSCFAMIQRYNRPRLIRILKKKEASARE